MWAALRYRKGQAAVLAALAGLITACAAFVPLYDRAMQQSLVDLELARLTPIAAGLQLEGVSMVAGAYTNEDQIPPPPPSALLGLMPADALASYGDPVRGWSAQVLQLPGGREDVEGTLLWRDGMCERVSLVSGRCPEATGEVLVSAADVAGLGLALGATVTVAGEPRQHPSGLRPTPTSLDLRVVGSYDAPDDEWFGRRLTGISGSLSQGNPSHLQHDIWLTAEATFTTPVELPLQSAYVGLPLRSSEQGVDQVLSLADEIDRIDAGADAAVEGANVTVRSALPEIAEQVRAQRADSRVTVPLLLIQLGLLALVVLWLVLAAVTDQRRPEVALARLRGHGVRGARRLLLGELLPAVLGGVAPGALLALAAGWVAARLLPGHAGVEPGVGFLLATGLAALVLSGVAALAAARVARVPVDGLLRRSAAARRGWRVGVLDAMLVAAGGAAVAAFLTGSLEGPAAMAAPAVLALVVGVLLAHAATPLAALVGGALLRRGAARTALGLLEAGRSVTLRSTVVVVTVATALTAFAINAVLVGDRNREAAARQEAGAPLVAAVAGTDLAAVRAALADVDPSGRRATPVVAIRPPGAGTVTTLAVDPAAFRDVALLDPGEVPDRAWDRLAPATAEPLRLAGDRLTLTATSRLEAVATDGNPASVSLGVDYLTAGQPLHAELGPLPPDGRPHRLSASLFCGDGCHLTGLSLSTIAGTRVQGTVTLGSVSGSESGPLALGPATDWTAFADPDDGLVTPTAAGAGALALEVDTDGPQRVSVAHGWLPDAVPALATPDVAAEDDRLALSGLDGRERPGTLTGRVDRVPGAPPRTAVVDLELLERAGPASGQARIEVWLGTADAALLDELTAALAERHVAVVETRSRADVRAGLDASMAAWSLQLAAVVGWAALAIAVLMLVVVAVSGWRVRARDLASLWLSGVPRRTVRGLALTAQLVPVLLGVVAGLACGLLGASVSMPTIPLFAVAPDVSTLDLDTPWPAVLLTAVGCLLALAAAGAAAGWAVLRRARLDLLREGL